MGGNFHARKCVPRRRTRGQEGVLPRSPEARAPLMSSYFFAVMNLLKLFTRNKTWNPADTTTCIERLPLNDAAESLFRQFVTKEFSTENLDAYLDLRRQKNFSPLFSHVFFKRYIADGCDKSVNLPSHCRPTTPYQLGRQKFDAITTQLVYNLTDSWLRFVQTPEGKEAIRLLSTMKMPKK